MRSVLNNYRRLEDGPMVAHHIRVEWPAKDGFMDFRLDKNLTDDWEKLSPEHGSFRRPEGAEVVEHIGPGL